MIKVQFPALAPTPRLGQQTNYITTDDFRGYVSQAQSSIKAVADIARAYDLSEEEERIIQSEIGKLSGYTIPMAVLPPVVRPSAEAPVPVQAIAPGREETPWWIYVGGGLIVGGIIGALAF